MVKIALIDTGVDNNYINRKYSNINIKNFYIKDGYIHNGSKNIEIFHGTCCCDKILSENKDVQIIDINILDDQNNILLDSLIVAINKAIDEKVDIINISVGFTKCSQKLQDVCKKASDNNIIIVSALDPSLNYVYPAQIGTVLSVKGSESQINDIEIIDFKTVSLKSDPEYYKFQDIKYYIGGTSLLCARFSGKLSVLFDQDKIYSRAKILKKHFGLDLNNKYELNSSIWNNRLQHVYKGKEIDENSKIGIVIFPIDEIYNIKKTMLIKNIVAYYDFDNKCFKNILSNIEIANNDIDVILIINTRYHHIEIDNNFTNKYSEKKIVVVNNKKNAIVNNMYEIDKPIILILGLCHSTQKFKTQLNIHQSLISQSITPYNITYNPLGYVYGFDVLKFPNKIVFSDIVYDINGYVSNIERNNNIDILSINIGGGISYINNYNVNCFGTLTKGYMYALNVDIAVLCIPCLTNIDFLKTQVKNIYNYGVKEVFVVISDNIIDASTLEDYDELQLYKASKLKYMEYCNNLNNIQSFLSYRIDNVEQERLCKDIISVLS